MSLVKKQVLLFIAIIFVGLKHSSAQLNCQFTASALFGCPPLVVNFQDQSTGGPTTYYWDFDNGNVSAVQNPVTSFASAGIYNIMHVVSNGSSSDTAYLQIRVFQSASVNFSAPDNHGCIFPCHTVHFTNLTIPGESPVDQYVWDFGDGSLPSQSFNANHCYNAVGAYNVTLVALDSNGCQSSKIIPNYVVIGNNPTSSASVLPAQSCTSPQLVNFSATGNSNNGNITYSWFLGNGGTSALQNPSTTYSSGLYNPFVVVTDTLGCQDTSYVNVAVTNMSADFTSTSQNACTGIPMQFTDLSNFASSWSWNFGDGGTSNVQNPQHTYNASGTYTVTLVATYGICSDTIVKVANINVTNPVNFVFSVDDTSSCSAPFTVNFTSNVSGTPNGYSWNFGDGGTSTLANPSHTYTSNGSYTVTLAVSNASGCVASQTLSSAITIGALNASFTFDSSQGCTPLTVHFTNTSSSNTGFAAFNWSFGDGTTAVQQNPTHVYTTPGTYLPYFVVRDVQGCLDTFVSPDSIRVGLTLIPDFIADPLVQCVNLPIQFTNLTQNAGPAVLYNWDFGDGQHSTLPSPQHFYSDTGFYTITLTSINQGCMSDTVRIDYIQIVVPKADFYFDFDCSNPTTVAFFDTSQGADTWYWDFGDGTSSTQQDPVHTFPSQNNYDVKLIVTNNTTGCVDSVTKNIAIGTPLAGFDSDTNKGCIPFAVNFTDTSIFASSWRWYFGDGGTSTQQNPTHTYVDTGSYTVTLIINPTDSCSDSITYVNYITAFGVYARVSAIPNIGCVPLTVSFQDSSVSYNGSIVYTQWSFGTGDSSYIPNPTYTYTTDGTYTARLFVQDSHGCTAHDNQQVKARDVVADFTCDTAVCPGEAVTFVNQSSSNTNTYFWDFGDGATSTLQNPVHAWGATGTYSVTLIVSNSSQGCSDTLVKSNLLDVDTPTADFFVTTTFAPCPPFPVQFYNITNRTDLNWLWYFGDGDTSTAYNPLHVYFFPGDYDVTLISWDSSGCRDSITYVDLIRVRGPIGNFSASPDSGCAPVTVSISGTTQSTVSMIADLGDGTVYTDSINVIHTYATPGNYYPVYTLTDSLGCTVAYPIDTIVAGLIPYPNLPDDTTVCKGNYVGFNLPYGDHFLWQSNILPTYLTCDTCKNTVASAPDTITYYVTAITNLGCIALDTITVNVDALPVIFPGISFRICPSDTLQLIAGPNVASAIWEPSTYMDDSTIVNPQVWPPDSMIYRVTGFNSTGCSISRIVRVWVIHKVVADIGIDDTLVCDGGNVRFDLDVYEASFNDTSFLWSPSTYLSSPLVEDPVLDAPTGDYTYTVIVSSSTCEPDTDKIHVVIAPNPVVEAGDDQVVTPGTQIQLWAASPDDVNYVWYPVDEMSCTNCRRPYLTANQNQTIPVVVTNQYGCTDTDYVEIRVVECKPEMVYVPNTFTPNGDGLNDKLYVRGIGLRALNYFRVFDRWGRLVYDSKNISDGWDGTINGKEADVATYVYVLNGYCSSGQEVEKSGNVTLIR